MHWWLELSEALRNVGILAGGAFGLYLAWKRVVASNNQADASLRQSDTAIKQAELARRAHVAELFNQSVGQLGEDKLEIRLGAIYTLRQISRDFPDLTEAVFELLSVYVRENSKTELDSDRIDIFEIVNVLREKVGPRA